MKLSSLQAASWMMKGALIACQPLDVALTAWLLATYVNLGAREINPLVEPLTGSTWGLLVLLAVKLVLAIRIAMMRVRCVLDLVVMSIVLIAYLAVVGWNVWIALSAAVVV